MTEELPFQIITPNVLPRWKAYWRYMPGKTRKEKRALARAERKRALALKRIQ